MARAAIGEEPGLKVKDSIEGAKKEAEERETEAAERETEAAQKGTETEAAQKGTETEAADIGVSGKDPASIEETEKRPEGRIVFMEAACIETGRPD